MPKEKDLTSSPNSGILDAPPSGSISRSHANILNFVAKQQSKSIAAKELIYHVIFSVIFLTIFGLQRSVYESYLMNQSLSTAFVTQNMDPSYNPFPTTFLDLGQFSDLSDYMLDIVAGTLDQSESYSGQPLTPYKRNFFMANNRLLGGVRFRQLRAAPNKGCTVPRSFQGISKVCYSFGYLDSNKDTTPFGPANDPQRYTYQSAAESGSSTLTTPILYSLDGGGYVVDMPLGSNFSDLVNQLVEDEWWDEATRAIIVTMNFLSIDLGNRVAVMYLVVEMPGNGEVMPSVTFKTFRLDMYSSDQDWFRFALEVIFVMLLAFMIFREASELRLSYYSKKGVRKYFSSGWNLNELAIIMLFLASISVYLSFVIAAYNHPDLTQAEYFPYMEQLGNKIWIYYNIGYFIVLLVCFQTFKYLRMNRRLYMLWKTLQNSGTDLMGFMMIFLIFVFGFVFNSWLAFGDATAFFGSFSTSFGTGWNFIIGNPPDYDTIVNINAIQGPLYYVVFAIFLFYILPNMFIAIIVNSYGEISTTYSEQVGISDAINSKLSECFKSSKKLAKKLIDRSKSKRSILQILESLSYPEILEKPGLTIEDVIKACGPDTTEAEALELFEWIEKLESKKKQTQRRATMSELDLSDDDMLSMGTEMKPQKSEYVELLASVDSLREDLQRLLQFIPQLQQLPPLQPPLPPQEKSRPPSSPLPPLSSPQAPSSPAPPPTTPPPTTPPPAVVVHEPPPERPQSVRVGPPPATPPIPPLQFSTMLLAAQAQAQVRSRRDSIGPPPPTPNVNIRTSSHYVPPIPPPPQHEHPRSLHDRPSTSPHDRTSASPSAPSSPNLRAYPPSHSPSRLPIPQFPITDPPFLVLDPPLNDGNSPRL
jgi:hypothetical protein